MLSSLSVSWCPVGRLRHWCSSRYLRIPPLHREFHLPLHYSRKTVLKAIHGLSPWISLPTCLPACAPFTPSNSGQRLHPTFYRGCWHVVSRVTSFVGYRHYLPQQQEFTIRRPSSSTRRRCIRFPPLCNISHCCLPVGVWAVSQSQCGRSTSQSGYRSSPCGPLPHQLANRTRGHLKADCSFSLLDAELWAYAVLAVVSNCCPPL